MKSINLLLVLLLGVAAVSAAPAPFTTVDKPDTFTNDVPEARRIRRPQPPGPPSEGNGGQGGDLSPGHPPKREDNELEARHFLRPHFPVPPTGGKRGEESDPDAPNPGGRVTGA
ncbi:unnamed protein product [Tilletia controversa]|uniref:Uncharacterized protein n=3 Tax=Tilletia TaxID=13289 RepID=A0A8X7MXG5_9BASI|nr:hypothetical protein CF336_g2677 [Tilletia laevis]KAE8202818.1 hypothetical protein CF328_g1996 [Tilletia controversa]KAE8243322.1 hypothetical protein A4X03_0g7795 [Tilletia caries]KAE8207378.1 hypothetical protein CF335_g1191 [Tilletia laevis]KAE8251873.1 hypothetical protein A4X06_0g2498 [Tilletia controversa]